MSRFFPPPSSQSSSCSVFMFGNLTQISCLDIANKLKQEKNLKKVWTIKSSSLSALIYFQIKRSYIQEPNPWKKKKPSSVRPSSEGPPSPPAQSQGCQAGSMRHRLSRLFAAATRVLTLLSPPSNWARLWRRVMMAVTAFWTSETNCWESMFSGCPAGDNGMDVSSWVFLCHAMISSRRTAFKMPSTYGRRTVLSMKRLLFKKIIIL